MSCPSKFLGKNLYNYHHMQKNKILHRLKNKNMSKLLQLDG